MNFINASKRFLAPVMESKVFCFQQIFKWVITGGNPFIHVFFIQLLVWFLENSNQESFWNYFLVYIGYIMFYELIDGMTYNWWWYQSEPKMKANISNKYMSWFIVMDNNHVERIWSWKMVSIIEKWIETWSLNLNMLLWNGWGILITFLVATLYIWSISLLGAALFILFFLWVLYITMFLNSKMISFRRKRIEQVHLYTWHVVKMIMSKMEILQSGKLKEENKIATHYLDRNRYYNLKMSPYFHAFFRLPQFFVICIKVSFLYYISWYIFEWNISIASFVGLFWVMTLLEQTIMRFVDFFKNFTKDFVTIQHLWDFFDTTDVLDGYDTWKKFLHEAWKISLQNISYGYTSEKPIFKDFTLDIPWNQITALVGPSGWWKSTLVKLISGYIRQDNWDILIDNQNLRKVSLKSYYRDIGYLTQEPSVFDGSVKENLLYAVTKDPSKKQLEEVIKLAHCEFIYDLPKWLDTEIGERWVKLSGGQKQRLAIAKIFLKDPKIIILDEPTSALDSMSEQKITEAMQNLFKWRTVIIIAHRLQTVKHADDIIVIEWWEIIERGTHTSLIRKKGYYKQMLDLQSWF